MSRKTRIGKKPTPKTPAQTLPSLKSPGMIGVLLADVEDRLDLICQLAQADSELREPEQQILPDAVVELTHELHRRIGKLLAALPADVSAMRIGGTR